MLFPCASDTLQELQVKLYDGHTIDLQANSTKHVVKDQWLGNVAILNNHYEYNSTHCINPIIRRLRTLLVLMESSFQKKQMKLKLLVYLQECCFISMDSKGGREKNVS